MPTTELLVDGESPHNHITSISESSCKFVESLDTTHPGIIEASRKLVALANQVVPELTQINDPVLTGEILLLAGYSALLYTQGKQPTNMAVYLDGLVLNKKKLPTQTIFVAMTEEEEESSENEVPEKPSPRSKIQVKDKPRKVTSSKGKKNSTKKKSSPIEIETYQQEDIAGDEIEVINLRELQANLDNNLSPELLQAVREAQQDAGRFYDKPSLANQPLPENLGSPYRASIQPVGQIAGLHGRHD